MKDPRGNSAFFGSLAIGVSLRSILKLQQGVASRLQ